MDYNVFLDYAFPAFGVCAVMALLSYGLMHVDVDKYNIHIPDKVGEFIAASILIIFGLSTLGMVLIGFLLPWGSPF